MKTIKKFDIEKAIAEGRFDDIMLETAKNNFNEGYKKARRDAWKLIKDLWVKGLLDAVQYEMLKSKIEG